MKIELYRPSEEISQYPKKSNDEYELLEKILSESKKQTELLEKIYNVVKPPVILDGSMPEEKREILLKALEGLDENKEEHLE